MVENTSVSTTPEPRIIYSQYAIILAVVFCILFIILGTFGNSLTILALLKSRKLRCTPTSYFVISLSVTDLIFCTFNLPITAIRYSYQKWVLGQFLCKLFPFFFYLNVAASIFTIMAITINRYVLIAHYTVYDKIYRKINASVMVLLCWVFPLALLVPTLAEVWGKFGYLSQTFSCTILESEDGKSPKKFLFLLGFFLPAFVIIFCYARISCIVFRSRQNITSHSETRNRTHSNPNNPESMALTRVVLVIFAAFILCYLPLMLANVFDDNDHFPNLHVIASILAWSASVINPFIYGVMSSRYRKAYTSVLPCCSRKLQASGPTFSSGLRSSSNVPGGRNSMKMTESFNSGHLNATTVSQLRNSTTDDV